MISISDAWEMALRFRALGGLLAPIMVPLMWRAIASYRASARDRRIRPLPRPVAYSMAGLVSSALLYIYLLFVQVKPLNIFAGSLVASDGRKLPKTIKYSAVIGMLSPEALARLAPGLLGERLNTATGRTVYAVLGPDAAANCVWCSTDSAIGFVLYALPELLAPYLLSGLLILFVTSPSAVSRWHKGALAVLTIMAVVDLGAVWAAAVNNANDTKPLAAVHWLYWKRKDIRYGVLALYSLLLALLLYVSSTGRLFARRPQGELVAEISRRLASATNRATATSFLRAAIGKRPDHVDSYRRYWARVAERETLLQHNSDWKEAKENAMDRIEQASGGSGGVRLRVRQFVEGVSKSSQ